MVCKFIVPCNGNVVCILIVPRMAICILDLPSGNVVCILILSTLKLPGGNLVCILIVPSRHAVCKNSDYVVSILKLPGAGVVCIFLYVCSLFT